MDNAVCIDIKGDFDLWHAARGWWNPHQIELSQQLVVIRHFPFALEDANGHCCLVIGCGREDLALFGRNGRVAFDQFGKYAAERFNTQ